MVGGFYHDCGVPSLSFCLAGVEHVWSNGVAFFALLQTGKVVAWGDADLGGRLDVGVKAQLEKIGLAAI